MSGPKRDFYDGYFFRKTGAVVLRRGLHTCWYALVWQWESDCVPFHFWRMCNTAIIRISLLPKNRIFVLRVRKRLGKEFPTRKLVESLSGIRCRTYSMWIYFTHLCYLEGITMPVIRDGLHAVVVPPPQNRFCGCLFPLEHFGPTSSCSPRTRRKINTRIPSSRIRTPISGLRLESCRHPIRPPVVWCGPFASRTDSHRTLPSGPWRTLARDTLFDSIR
mmetsp:Transcript_19116/g.40053  ORF Transcript_19116/g.40053 Transcript_19116/m.40053 type:complete len:219 (+) Transcript_19116:535-1191(+)